MQQWFILQKLQCVSYILIFLLLKLEKTKIRQRAKFFELGKGERPGTTNENYIRITNIFAVLLTLLYSMYWRPDITNLYIKSSFRNFHSKNLRHLTAMTMIWFINFNTFALFILLDWVFHENLLLYTTKSFSCVVHTTIICYYISAINTFFVLGC